VGVIAEELPEVLASADRKGLELGRNVGFLMGVVKALKAENDKNAEMIAELRAEIEALKARR
jgi:flagellar biosynthesis/type III secretory pathway protein FliH